MANLCDRRAVRCITMRLDAAAVRRQRGSTLGRPGSERVSTSGSASRRDPCTPFATTGRPRGVDMASPHAPPFLTAVWQPRRRAGRAPRRPSAVRSALTFGPCSAFREVRLRPRRICHADECRSAGFCRSAHGALPTRGGGGSGAAAGCRLEQHETRRLRRRRRPVSGTPSGDRSHRRRPAPSVGLAATRHVPAIHAPSTHVSAVSGHKCRDKHATQKTQWHSNTRAPG